MHSANAAARCKWGARAHRVSHGRPLHRGRRSAKLACELADGLVELA